MFTTESDPFNPRTRHDAAITTQKINSKSARIARKAVVGPCVAWNGPCESGKMDIARTQAITIKTMKRSDSDIMGKDGMAQIRVQHKIVR
jgi:hypothetical protein